MAVTRATNTMPGMGHALAAAYAVRAEQEPIEALQLLMMYLFLAVGATQLKE